MTDDKGGLLGTKIYSRRTLEGFLDEEVKSIRHKSGIESVSDNSRLRSSARSSRPYDGSFSSPDHISGSKPPNNYKLLSRRTFKNTKDNVHVNHSSLESSKERLKGVECNLESSYTSNEYRALRNWIDSTEGSSSSTTRNSTFEDDSLQSEYLDIDRQELLKKVEDLINQISGLSSQRVDSRRTQYVRNYLPRQSCGTNGPFKASSCCHYSPTHHKDLDLENKYIKNKRVPAKRHCLPLIGGAPFVICNNCFKLLQLPTDFLPSKKRLQKLKCGACSEVTIYRPQEYATSRPSNVKYGADALQDRPDPVSYTDNSREAPSAMALHRHLGYSSARELLYQLTDIDEAYESIWQDLKHDRQDGS